MVQDRVRDLVRQLMQREGFNMKSLSLKIGREQSFMHNFLQKGVPARLKEGDREALANLFGVTADEFRHEPPHSTAMLPSKGQVLRIAGDDFASLPVYDLRFSAGHGSMVGDDPEPMYWQPFRVTWLRTLGAPHPEDLIVGHVEGDSMEPTLLDGDQVLIDRRRRELTRDGIYAYRIGDGLNVKRISIDPSSRFVTITSDNARYPTHPGVNPDTLDVIGRVIWLGRRV